MIFMRPLLKMLMGDACIIKRAANNEAMRDSTKQNARNLAERCREHVGIAKTGSTMNNNNSSAVYNYFASTGHLLSSDNFDVISHANSYIDHLIHESLLIFRDRPTPNAQMPSCPLTHSECLLMSVF